MWGWEGRHGGPAGLRRVQPASARIDTILSNVGVGVGVVTVALGILGGGKGGTVEEEEDGLLREGTLL